MHQHRTLEDTVYFWFAANDTSGSGNNGASPVYDVRLAGDAAGAIPVLSGSGTLLSHANYPAGCHEVSIAATAANGFSAGNTYAVFCTLLVDSQNPTGFIGSFTLAPIISNVTQIVGGSQSATDLKDFSDTGYDPATKKVQGVVLVDTVTTNTDVRGTDSAALASELVTAQNDLDILTGTDGATLATAQAKYAPSKAGDNMGLLNSAIDALLARPISNLDATGTFRSLYGAISKLVNKFDRTTNVGKVTIFKTNDTTELATQSLTTDSAAEPITAVDTID